LIAEFSERIASAEFAQIARHPEFPKAFTRKSKLPLPALIASLLSMRNESQQAMLDGFFASVYDTSTPVRGVPLPPHAATCTCRRWSRSMISWCGAPTRPA
jgi:hypothetical protein